jgi:Fe2+ or Zn2+ uptake regulation protein
MRQTKTREEVLTFLQTQHRAYTPYEIAGVLKINPVTVYRILEFFKKEKKIHHIPSLGKWSACHCEEKIQEDHGFMICRKCESVEEFSTPHQCLHSHGFQCEEHLTEILGVCRTCQTLSSHS